MHTRASIVIVLGLSGAASAQSTPGFIVRAYATVKDPVSISFAPDGTMFVGRDNAGSGGGSGDAVKFWRVGPGGSPVEEYGKTAQKDPDAVCYDPVGKVSGLAGSVVFGGAQTASTGSVFVAEPDQDVRTLFGPSSSYVNPTGFAFDADGTLYFTDYGSTGATGRVLKTDGGEPEVLGTFSPSPRAIALHPDGRMFITQNDGRIAVLSATGSVLDPNLADGFTDATTLALGPAGDPWGGHLYALEIDGTLWKVAIADGAKTNLGETGADYEIRFGPDGAAYFSDFGSDKIMRMVPCRVNCNGDGSLNVNDFICFQSKWRTRDAYGDYDKSGTYTVNDFIRYQADFVKGCP